MWKTTRALIAALALTCAGCSTLPLTPRTGPSKPSACLRTCPNLDKYEGGDFDLWVLDLIGRYAECRRMHDECRAD